MRILLSLIALIGLSAMPLAAHSAKLDKTCKSSKEHLVLMPLRVDITDKNLQTAMEAAIAQGLQQKYEVFLKKSQSNIKKVRGENGSIKCIPKTPEAKLIAAAGAFKRDDGYVLSLTIQNTIQNKVVYSNAIPCKRCDIYQVVDKIKELGVASAPPSPPTQPLSNTDGSFVGSKTHPLENSLFFAEVQVCATDDCDAHLSKFSNNRPRTLAQVRITGLKKEVEQVAIQNPVAGGIFQDCPDCPEMIVIPAGNFDMGSKNGESDEKPVHQVSISKPFAIGRTEVTQGQWRAMMGNNPSKFKNCGDDCPVEMVSWEAAHAYIRALNIKTGKQYRLPSEAEWEYACRAGEQHQFCGGDSVKSVAWFADDRSNTTHLVGRKQINAFGLYDMSGNVWEWVEDNYHDNYEGAPTDGGAWIDGGGIRVLRGGSWRNDSLIVRAAHRGRHSIADGSDTFGFRLARMLP